MRLLRRLFSDRGAREKWEAGLVWFRLRYLDAERTTRCLNLLARPELGGRVALHHVPGAEVTCLYLGLPAAQVDTATRLARDCGFSLVEATETPVQAVTPLLPVTSLPWDREFVAHVVGKQVFVDEPGDLAGAGRFLPSANGHAPATWALPDIPPLGMTLQPVWFEESLSGNPVVNEPDQHRWPLGDTWDGVPRNAPGRLNLYGESETVAVWLVEMVTRLLSSKPRHLLVIDGAGNALPQLKRRPGVTRLLGRGLHYIDLNGKQASGFNPLAAVSEESPARTIQRWRCWFAGMHVQGAGLDLLESVWRAGIRDLLAMQKWLKRSTQAGSQVGLLSLQMAVNRLLASHEMHEWAAWPGNPFTNLSEDALFLACRADGWHRHQLLHAALLLGTAWPKNRIIVHGYPWPIFPGTLLLMPKAAVISNGPLMPDSAVVLTRTSEPGARTLANRFLYGSPAAQEVLQLLRPGAGLLVTEKRIVDFGRLENGSENVIRERSNKSSDHLDRRGKTV